MKCRVCGKKVLLQFTCKCEQVFCIKHHAPEDHACTFDYKGEYKTILQTRNPKLESDKGLEKMI